MTADVIQIRDFARPPVAVVIREEPAEVVILPVIRVERAIAEMIAPPRRARRSLLGDPA